MTARIKGPSAANLQRELIDAVGVLLSQARSVLFITGAGVPGPGFR